MKNLIYYPNFESNDIEWLKFALLYIENFSPIVPHTGDRQLSELYRKLSNETDLLNLHRPTYLEGSRATIKAIRYISSVLKNPHSFIEELNSINATRIWKNPSKQEYLLFSEKYTNEWEYFCKENDFVKDTNEGLLISKNLAEIYMTFLAQEVAYSNDASPITDKKYLDELSIRLKTKNIEQDNKIIVAKSIITEKLPIDFRNIEIEKVIKIRNKKGFKEKQIGFHNELNKLYENIGMAIDPKSFISDYNKSILDWKNELFSYGINLSMTGLSAYILINNQSATSPEYLKQAIELGLVIGSGFFIKKNLNKGTDKKSVKQYLTEIGNIK